jgi:hypothetical protein
MQVNLAAVLTAGTLVAIAGPALAQNDAYCLQSGKWGFRGTASSRPIASAWKRRLAPLQYVAGIR